MRSHQFRPNIGQGQMRYEHFKTKCLNSNESTRPRSNRASLLRQSLSRQRDTKPATRAEDQRALTKRPAGRPVGATGTIMMRQQQRVDTIRNDVMETTIRTTCLQCSSNEELDAFSSACSMLTSMITANCNYQPVQCQSMMSTMKAETLPNSPERTDAFQLEESLQSMVEQRDQVHRIRRQIHQCSKQLSELLRLQDKIEISHESDSFA